MLRKLKQLNLAALATVTILVVATINRGIFCWGRGLDDLEYRNLTGAMDHHGFHWDRFGEGAIFKFLLSLMQRVGADRDEVLRLPSLVFGLANVWLVFLLGKRLWSAAEGRHAAIFMVVAYASSYEGVIADISALSTMSVLVSALVLTHALDHYQKFDKPQPQRDARVLVAIGMSLVWNVLLHIHTAIFAIVELFVLLLALGIPRSTRQRLSWPAWGSGMVLLGVALPAVSTWILSRGLTLADTPIRLVSGAPAEPWPTVVQSWALYLLNDSPAIAVGVLALLVMGTLSALDAPYNEKEIAEGDDERDAENEDARKDENSHENIDEVTPSGRQVILPLLLLWMLLPFVTATVLSRMHIPQEPRDLAQSFPALALIVAHAVELLRLSPRIRGWLAIAAALAVALHDYTLPDHFSTTIFHKPIVQFVNGKIAEEPSTLLLVYGDDVERYKRYFRRAGVPAPFILGGKYGTDLSELEHVLDTRKPQRAILMYRGEILEMERLGRAAVETFLQRRGKLAFGSSYPKSGGAAVYELGQVDAGAIQDRDVRVEISVLPEDFGRLSCWAIHGVGTLRCKYPERDRASAIPSEDEVPRDFLPPNPPTVPESDETLAKDARVKLPDDVLQPYVLTDGRHILGAGLWSDLAVLRQATSKGERFFPQCRFRVEGVMSDVYVHWRNGEPFSKDRDLKAGRLSDCRIAGTSTDKRRRQEIAQQLAAHPSAVMLRITLVPADVNVLTCRSDRVLDGLRCSQRLDGKPNVSENESRRNILQPLSTVEKFPLLGVGIWDDPQVAQWIKDPQHQERFTARCRFEPVGIMDVVEAHWFETGKWEKLERLYAGRVRECVIE